MRKKLFQRCEIEKISFLQKCVQIDNLNARKFF